LVGLSLQEMKQYKEKRMTYNNLTLLDHKMIRLIRLNTSKRAMGITLRDSLNCLASPEQEAKSSILKLIDMGIILIKKSNHIRDGHKLLGINNAKIPA